MICPRCFKETELNQNCPFCEFSFEKEDKRREKANALPMLYLLADRYQLGELLGAGGFGITYLARDVESKEILAVKEFFPSHICSRDSSCRVVPLKNEENYETSVKHFFEEARALFLLKNCPSVACVKAFFRSNNTAYIVMEHIKGKNLAELADESTKKMPYRQAKNFVVQIALALNEVHAHGMIHSDISPVNVLVNESGDVKLIDFGASRNFVEKNGDNLTVQLKPGYAPPEQYWGSRLPLGPWTDVYALAATFYRLVTGEVPPAADARRNGRELSELTECVPEIEERVNDCIKKALSLNYRDRYANANEFLADFSDYTLEDNRTDESGLGGNGTQKKNVLKNLISRIKKAKVPSHEPPCMAVAEIVVGKDPGKQYRLEAGKQYFLGRQTDMCNIVVSEATTVSRVHCVITCSEDGKTITVADKSSNGLSVDGGAKLMGRSVAVSNSCELVFSNGAAVVSIIWNQKQENI